MKASRICAAAAAVVAGTALSACGFNYPTDRPYTPAAGVNSTSGTVDVLNAAVVSRAPDSGTFVASLVNNSHTKSVTLNGLAGDGTAIGNVDSQPLEVKPGLLVNLATQGGIPVNGTFQAGQFVSLSLTFDDGQSTTMNVPVVAEDQQWAGLDTSTPSPSAPPSATTNESASASPSS